MIEALILIGFALFVGVIGVALGMLVAPMVGRLGERGEDEEDRDGD
jgi:hypothetical protein